MTQLDSLIDARSDDVRAYPLLTTGRHAIYGCSSLPDGVLMVWDGQFIQNLDSKVKIGRAHV